MIGIIISLVASFIISTYYSCKQFHFGYRLVAGLVVVLKSANCRSSYLKEHIHCIKERRHGQNYEYMW